MSRYAVVPFSMFDGDFVGLSPEAQRLELFIRTCPTRADEAGGLFRFRFGMVEDELGMPRDQARAALRELIDAGRPFEFDDSAGVIFDRDALVTNTIGKNRDRITGAINRLRALPTATPLRGRMYALARKIVPMLADAIVEAYPELATSCPVCDRQEAHAADDPCPYDVDPRIKADGARTGKPLGTIQSHVGRGRNPT